MSSDKSIIGRLLPAWIRENVSGTPSPAKTTNIFNLTTLRSFSRFSGITCAMLNGETTSLKDVQFFVFCSMNAFPDAYLYSMLLTLLLGPDFGSPPSFVRRKLLTVLSECALLKVRKEVMNDRVHFVWTQFSKLNSYFKKQADDEGKLNGKLAEMISLFTCEKKSAHRKGMKCSSTSELKEILTRMLGLRKMLVEQKETAISLEKIVKVLEELQAQAEVALCFVGVENRGHERLVFGLCFFTFHSGAAYICSKLFTNLV
ncbi:hypothetical protein POTOM_009770 [Populus tomentosa]|uniref:Uncharacterized protein n=1 Tax=Populus tomentosa TaxID=118781 RepID=A0A8X8D1P8_POPTO|nr:hypothetical protein POTOM_009770 [Populus tomentosa]